MDVLIGNLMAMSLETGHLGNAVIQSSMALVQLTEVETPEMPIPAITGEGILTEATTHLAAIVTVVSLTATGIDIMNTEVPDDFTTLTARTSRTVKTIEALTAMVPADVTTLTVMTNQTVPVVTLAVTSIEAAIIEILGNRMTPTA